MNQRHYPCFILSGIKISNKFWLDFHLDGNHSFVVENSIDYSYIAHRGLRDSHSLKVPFYNEVQS